jgi:hypothetical protein
VAGDVVHSCWHHNVFEAMFYGDPNSWTIHTIHSDSESGSELLSESESSIA